MLKGLLYGLNAPFLFLPAFLAKGGGAPVEAHLKRLGREADRLPAGHPLYSRVAAIGRRAGIEVAGVFLDNRQRFHNASVTAAGKNKALLVFRGNPLNEPDGETILEGVSGHELAHIRRKTSDFRMLSDLTAIFYTAAAFPVGIAALAAGSLPALAAVPLTLGLALYGLPALNRVYGRNDEYLTDIEGATLTDNPDAAIRDLDYLRTCKVDQNRLAPSEQGTKWKRLCNIFLGRTHPPLPKRIDFLRTVFNRESGAADQPKTPETRPAMSL